MLTFSSFLKEESEQFGKLKHLEHNEDHVINNGADGYHRAVSLLKDVHHHITKGAGESKITTKFDGSPSIVFGHHPQTKKFFVATKSAFNVSPKVNYTEADIEKNHGHAPGLANKLKEALHNLKKIAPNKGVYQGDLMYSHHEVGKHQGNLNFTPNTITYTAKEKSPEGEKIKKSKIGVVVHTKYHGPTLEKMSAGFDPDLHNFKHHPDVNVINHEVDMSKVEHTPENEKKFQHHMALAHKAFSKAHYETFASTKPHKEHLNTYINDTVRTGEAPSVKGYREHLRKKFQKKIDAVKTNKSKLQKQQELDNHLRHVDEHEHHFKSLFDIHHHLQQAKDALVDSMEKSSDFEHNVGGERTSGEGFVVTHNGHPTKLVKRKEFSRLNFLKSKNR